MMGPLAGMVSGISAAQQTRAPPDQGHELTPDGADMGSLFPTPQEPSLAVNNPVGRNLWVPSRTGVVAPLSKLEKVDGGFAFK